MNIEKLLFWKQNKKDINTQGTVTVPLVKERPVETPSIHINATLNIKPKFPPNRIVR